VVSLEKLEKQKQTDKLLQLLVKQAKLDDFQTRNRNRTNDEENENENDYSNYHQHPSTLNVDEQKQLQNRRQLINLEKENLLQQKSMNEDAI
jgi:hypothetical protein